MPLPFLPRKRPSPTISALCNHANSLFISNNELKSSPVPFDGQEWPQVPPSYEQAVDRNNRAGLLLDTDKKSGIEPPSFSATSPANDQVSEAPLTMLANYDTVIIIDDSGSMLLPNENAVDTKDLSAQGISRWAVVSVISCSHVVYMS
jgi:hypothetical protein